MHARQYHPYIPLHAIRPGRNAVSVTLMIGVKAAEEPQALYWSMESSREISMLDFVRYLKRN